MKLYKRFAAVLLAGIMVLALLTACGSTPPQNPEEQQKADVACDIWQDKVCGAANKNLPRNEQLRRAAQDMGKELAAKGELITNGVYWGRLQDVQVPAGMEADFMVLTWDKKTPVTYKLDKLLDDARNPDWALGAIQKVRTMMRHVLVTEERLAKIEEADVAAIKNKDGTYSFVLGYIIAE